MGQIKNIKLHIVTDIKASEMVMAQTQHSNTQYVAHEFVRQYYTMLHKDPTQMHRFYTCESRLTHGVSPNAKSEDPVCGQQAIFEKISALKFHNCYAKIRSVDSHPTIGGGVVIQVSGELSNSGMAMRKFMQTFVLAQQDVKRYNVFNDIFRYQDETFEDTEVEESANGTGESENGYANHESAPVSQLDPIPDTEQEVSSDEDEVEVPISHMNDPYQSNNNDYYHVEAREETPSSADILQPEEVVLSEQEVVEDDGTEFKEYDGNDIKIEEPVEEVPQPTPEPEVEEPKVFSWAALTKKNTPAGSQTPAPPPAKPAVKKLSPQQPAKTAPKKREEAAPPKQPEIVEE